MSKVCRKSKLHREAAPVATAADARVQSVASARLTDMASSAASVGLRSDAFSSSWSVLQQLELHGSHHVVSSSSLAPSEQRYRSPARCAYPSTGSLCRNRRTTCTDLLKYTTVSTCIKVIRTRRALPSQPGGGACMPLYTACPKRSGIYLRCVVDVMDRCTQLHPGHGGSVTGAENRGLLITSSSLR